jgi:hypothetical protein
MPPRDIRQQPDSLGGTRPASIASFTAGLKYCLCVLRLRSVEAKRPVTRKLQAHTTFVRCVNASVGWALAAGRAILVGLVNPFTDRIEVETMHEATVSLLFMVIVMFPCLLSMAHPDL